MYYKLLKLKNRVYDAAKIDWDHMMFDRSAIWKLLIPLMIENFGENGISGTELELRCLTTLIPKKKQRCFMRL